MKIRLHLSILFLFAFSIYNFGYANLTPNPPKKRFSSSLIKTNHLLADTAPILKAEGNQTYCPLNFVNIVTDISITDPDPVETSIDAIYIQISSGYVKGEDFLTLNNASSHLTIIAEPMNSTEGKLTLRSRTGVLVTYSDFEKAIKDIQFNSTSNTPKGVKNFSISFLGDISYLPRNAHYYRYISDIGITWTNARDKAEAPDNKYFGLQGYLATLTAADEAQLAGEQAPGAGWIGGSDAETEGVWKWVTGPEPELGTIFWNGGSNGSPTGFAFWNNAEPNQLGDEDYAHITAPGIGIPGSWNDLQTAGNPSGDYQPKGYIVEYGGTPGDPVLHLSASTTLTIASISSTTTPPSKCDHGILTLQATATAGTINWYDAETGGNFKGTGTSFITPDITTTTTYYVETTTATCASSRTAVEAKIINTPTIISTNSPLTHCGPGSLILKATPTEGSINWYSQNGGNIVGTGLEYLTPTISSNTTYFAEAFNDKCINSTKEQVDLIIYPLPQVADETVEKCISAIATLDATIPNMKYLWNNGETTQTIETSTKGVYTVDVTSLDPENCTNRKTITVIENNEPEIKEVKVDETTITIELVKNEDYFEYSIDGDNFQSSNVFTHVPSGLQTAYVRDINRCSTDPEPFIVIIVPKFFTPNNDSSNDVWEVKGLADYPLGEVILFDRYGKLITKLNHSNPSWDGTFNKKPLTANDYWYVLKIDPNSPELRGHFSLMR